MSFNRRNDLKRRKELLLQLRCFLNNINKDKPCKRNKPSSSPPMSFYKDVSPQQDSSQHHIPVKEIKSVLLQGGVLYKCECIKRNGLQDRCMMLDCRGKPECLTPYPTCKSGQRALAKYMDHGNANAALKRLIALDTARESAFSDYCKLSDSNVNNDNIKHSPPLRTIPSPLSIKNPRMPLRDHRMFNTQQHQQLRQHYPPMQGVQPSRQELIYQQPMNYSHTQQQQHQQYFHPQNFRNVQPVYLQNSGYPTSSRNVQPVRPQNFGYPTSFRNVQPAYPQSQKHPIDQQYQFQMPTQFVQQYSHPYTLPHSPYIQNNVLPC